MVKAGSYSKGERYQYYTRPVSETQLCSFDLKCVRISGKHLTKTSRVYERYIYLKSETIFMPFL